MGTPDHFPAAFLHALFDFREQIRIFLLHPFIGSCRRHRELEVGILPHQVEHAAKGVAHDLDRFRPRPKPGHVDVRIAHESHRELLQPWFKNFEFGVRRLQRGIEPGLIPLVER